LPEQGEPAYDVAFDFGDVSLDELAGIVPDIAAYKTSGNLSLSVAAKGTGAQIPSTLKSKLDFKNVGVAPPQLGLPIKNLVGTADVSLSAKEESAKLTGLAFSMGGTRVQVGADLNSLRVPKGSFTVSADSVDVEKLMPPKQQQAKPAAPRPAAEKPAQPKAPAAESPLKGADLSGKISVGKGNYKTVEFANTEVAFRLKDGEVTVNRIYSALSGGEVDGSVKAAKVFEQPALSGTIALKDVDIKPLLALSERAKGMVEGRVSGNFQFDVPRLDPEQLMKRLKANGNVTLPRGQFNGFDLAKKLESVSQMSGVSGLGPENTVFRDLAVDFAVANEQAKISSMAMKLENFDVACSGTYGLDKSLDMRAQAILSEKLSAKNRGSNVQSYFENEQGRVVVPFVASGTLPRVRVTLDMERVSKKALEKGVDKLKEQLMEEIAGKKKPGEEEKPEEKLLREVGTQLLDKILKP
jgi:AsmA protein